MTPDPPTDVETILRRLCREHDVPKQFGERLRPLVQRALDSPPQRRRVLLRIVSRSFREERKKLGDIRRKDTAIEQEQQILLGIAKILHDWHSGNPPEELLPPEGLA